MGRGKYQKILAKAKLSYDDVVVLANARKIKGNLTGLLAIRHNGEDYIKIMSASAYEYLQRQINERG